MPRSIRQLLIAVAALAVLAGPAAAQDMTVGDITRMEQAVDQVGADILKVRQRDRAAARAFQTELADLEDEVTYLKVKLRRERHVSRADYIEVRDRVENLRSRVNGTDTYAGRYGGANPPVERTDRNPDRSATGTTFGNGVVPSGTELDVRLEQALSSDTNQVEDRFEATTVVDLREGGRVVIPAGSRVRGVVTAVRDAGRVERKGELQLSFDQITVNGRNYPLRGTVTQALESGGYKEDAEKIGAGAAVGAIIGGILGGVKGAITGILIGGGGVVAATEGQNVNLPVGTILRMRIDQDLNINRVTRQ
jgi:TolA-binding protein